MEYLATFSIYQDCHIMREEERVIEAEDLDSAKAKAEKVATEIEESIPSEDGSDICAILDGLNEAIDEEHYNDGMIDVRVINEFDRVVFVNCNGDAKAVSFDNNLFSPKELVEAYESMWRSDWNMDDEKAEYVSRYKSYMLKCGCKPEELGEK